MTARRARGGASTLIGLSLLRKWPLPALDPELGKEARGSVLVVGGSREIPGAVVLAAVATLRAGAGKLQIATARSTAVQVGVTVPEARVIGLAETHKGELAHRAHEDLIDEVAECDALLVGPGMSDEHAAVALLRHRPRARPSPSGTVVIDAAALKVFEERRPLGASRFAGVVITPHAGEMTKLCDRDKESILARPLEVAREAAKALDAIVVLKGDTTFVVAPGGEAYHNVAGNVGLGTSGSGDTLSGVIAGLAARGADALQAAVWGVHLHAKAGDALARKLGPLGYLAREVLDEIPPLLARIGRGAKTR